VYHEHQKIGAFGRKISGGSDSPDRKFKAVLLFIIERWPYIVIWAGLLLFWLACIDSVHLPFEAVLVGPVLMLAGVIMLRNKGKTR
jgi:hypothetical protein